MNVRPSSVDGNDITPTSVSFFCQWCQAPCCGRTVVCEIINSAEKRNESLGVADECTHEQAIQKLAERLRIDVVRR